MLRAWAYFGRVVMSSLISYMCGAHDDILLLRNISYNSTTCPWFRPSKLRWEWSCDCLYQYKMITAVVKIHHNSKRFQTPQNNPQKTLHYQRKAGVERSWSKVHTRSIVLFGVARVLLSYNFKHHKSGLTLLNQVSIVRRIEHSEQRPQVPRYLTYRRLTFNTLL